jgi:hypothetical protein
MTVHILRKPCNNLPLEYDGITHSGLASVSG